MYEDHSYTGGSGEVSRKEGEVSRKRGQVSRKEGQVSRKKGEVSRKEGQVSRKEGEVSRKEGQVSRKDKPSKAAVPIADSLIIESAQLYGSPAARAVFRQKSPEIDSGQG